MLCIRGKHCENGECVPDVKVCNMLCIRGKHCKNGECVPDVATDCSSIEC